MNKPAEGNSESITSEQLERNLGTKEVFAISAGAMISSGLFVLPAVAFGYLGPSILLAYFLASLFVVPALFAKVELTTAMPKSGGVYFFVTRSVGAFFGTFTGLASWFSLSLKSAFALIGIGIFLQPLIPDAGDVTIKLVAVACTALFAILNIVSVKESGRFQFILVLALLGLLGFFVVSGVGSVDLGRFAPFKPDNWRSVLTVTGIVFISFGGLTKVSSIGGEVKDPSRSIPRGMFGAFSVVSLLYLFVLFVVIGAVPGEELVTTMTPVSIAASKVSGNFGFILLAIGAMLAFITTGNAGLLAASRSPLAMARDGLLPESIGKVHRRFRTPVISIAITALFMAASIAFLDIEQLVKVASTMKLILFLSANVSVIVMRASGVVSYRPSFMSPLFPGLQIAGSLIYILLIIGMGIIPLAITLSFFALSTIWYFAYARKRASRDSAFIRMAKSIGRDIEADEQKLESELIDILRERDEVEEDRFDGIVRRAMVLDLDIAVSRDEMFSLASNEIGARWNLDSESIRRKLAAREAQSPTLLYPGVAIPHAVPHLIVEGNSIFDIVLVRNKSGILWNEAGEVVYTAFCLVGSEDERNFHLKALMSIAQILQDPEFHRRWMKARNDEELRAVLLLSKRTRS